MGKRCALISCVLLSVAAVTAQTAGTPERLLPQWLTGIIAVSGFLFIVFIVFLVQRAWCEDTRRKSAGETPRQEDAYETSLDTLRMKSVMETPRQEDGYEVLDTVRTKEEENAYDNLGMDGPEDKVTSM